MTEYTPIKLVWEYEGNYPQHISGQESWALVMDGGEKIARLLRRSDEFMQRVSRASRFSLVHKVQFRGLLPWDALNAGLDKDKLFELSDSGITTAEMDDVYEAALTTRLKRQPDGSFVCVCQGE